MKKKAVEYSIEHRTSAGEWVEEGLYFDTYEEALEELKLCPGQPKEKYRIVENEYTVLWEAK
jgi:hypothetical protein